MLSGVGGGWLLGDGGGGEGSWLGSVALKVELNEFPDAPLPICDCSIDASEDVSNPLNYPPNPGIELKALETPPLMPAPNAFPTVLPNPAPNPFSSEAVNPVFEALTY